jgi:hypothetical protein
MTTPKYKITIKDLETRGAVAKLERDGFKREQIISEMYKHTSGASTQERERIVSNLYNRNEPC